MRHLLLLLLSPVVLLSACTPSTPPEPEEPPPSPEARVLDSACPDWRWIGIASGASCPTPPAGWQHRPLFTPSSTASPSPLDAFCLYEHDGAGNTTEIPALVQSGDLVQADRDCAVVSGAFENELGNHFLDQTGPLVNGVPGGPGEVRLALLDTSPTGATLPTNDDTSDHGYTLTHLARRLLCGGKPLASCAVQLTNRLALDLEVVAVDPVVVESNLENGGHFGFIGDLATAIDAEVDEWLDGTSARRLVLNLSIAWDPQHLKNDADSQEAINATEAVRQALRKASCKGALAIAAAGNRQGGHDTSKEALLPAAWEHELAPDFTACTSLLPGWTTDAGGAEVPTGPGRPWESSGPSGYLEPLVYAVGAVDSHGVPLGIGRRDAIPRLAAYGNHGVTSDPKATEGHTAVYSGSSVATVVVSAAAAAAWRHRGNLPRHHLMNELHASGEDLERPAKLYPEGSQEPQVHRISLCNTLQHACQGPHCPDLGSLTCDSWQKTSPQWTPPEAPEPQNAEPIQNVLGTVDGCPNWLHYCDEGNIGEPTSDIVCPAGASYGIDDSAWTGPQPDDIPCPSCPIKDTSSGEGGNFTQGCEGYTLFFSVHPEYAGGNITQLTLEIGDNAYLLPLPEPGYLAPGTSLTVECLSGKGIENGLALSFVSELHGSGMNPVVLVD